MTRSTVSIIVAFLVCLMWMPGVSAHAQASDEAHLFLLMQTPEGPTIESITIGPGETKVFTCANADEGVFDIVFPPGRGQSAGLITPGSGTMIIARNVDGELRLQTRGSDKEPREYPAQSLEDLARHNVRVNITGRGHCVAYLIEQNRSVRPEVGPVANMFAGQVPAAMLEDAYVVQTEMYLNETGEDVAGVVPLELDRWPFVEVTLPDGTTSDFLVDIGAAGSVIDRALLSADAEIIESSMIEYSPAGKRMLKYEPGGATGKVQTVLGHAALESLQLGELVVPDVSVTVLESMPDFFDRPGGGLIGMDILQRTPQLTMSLRETGAHMAFSEAVPDESASAIEVPFAFVGSHLVIEASCNGVPAHFILDTGSPSVFLDAEAAAAFGVARDESKQENARGLDGGSIDVNLGVIDSLTLGNRTFGDVECPIGALSAFNALRGEEQFVGLMGNSFFARFSRIEVDYQRRIVRFVD